MLKMLKNSARNSSVANSALPRRPKGVSLISATSKLWNAGPRNVLRPERAEAALVGARSAGNVDGHEEERSVVRAAPEIIFAHGPAGREMRLRDQIGTIRAARTSTGLLHSGINREWRSAS